MTHSFTTRRSSDLRDQGQGAGKDGAAAGEPRQDGRPERNGEHGQQYLLLLYVGVAARGNAACVGAQTFETARGAAMPFDALGRGKRRRQRSEAGPEQADSDRARKPPPLAEAVTACPKPHTAPQHPQTGTPPGREQG